MDSVWDKFSQYHWCLWELQLLYIHLLVRSQFLTKNCLYSIKNSTQYNSIPSSHHCMNFQNPITGSIITQICVYGSIAITLLQMTIARGLIDFAAGVHALGIYSVPEFIIFQFLHLSPLHLLSNVIFWILIGPAFEAIIGLRRAALFCLIASLGIYASIHIFSTASVAGMSGLLLAILWALTVIYYRSGNPEYKSMLLLLAINIVIGFVGNVSLTAHAAGAVIGIILGFIWLKNNLSTSRY